jgi:aromatic ring-opening dioxygenase LigB subunit
MPHPPIIVPEVGRERTEEAAVTLAGVSALADRVGGSAPDALLVLSPHQPYSAGSLAVNRSAAASGSFAPFGAPSVEFSLRTSIGGVDSLAPYLDMNGIKVSLYESRDLNHDQGTTVPLYFLRERFKNLPDVVLSSPIGLGFKDAFSLGQTLAGYDDGRKWALLASGDLSHRLKQGAPAGYSPRGAEFDAAVVSALRARDAAPLLEMRRSFIEDAGECGLRSVLAMIGLCASLDWRIDVLSYEGPFGVGYCTAVGEAVL